MARCLAYFWGPGSLLGGRGGVQNPGRPCCSEESPEATRKRCFDVFACEPSLILRRTLGSFRGLCSGHFQLLAGNLCPLGLASASLQACPLRHLAAACGFGLDDPQTHLRFVLASCLPVSCGSNVC